MTPPLCCFVPHVAHALCPSHLHAACLLAQQRGLRRAVAILADLNAPHLGATQQPQPELMMGWSYLGQSQWMEAAVLPAADSAGLGSQMFALRAGRPGPA